MASRQTIILSQLTKRISISATLAASLSFAIAAHSQPETKTYDFVLEKGRDVKWIVVGLEDDGGYRKAHSISLALLKLGRRARDCTLSIQVNGNTTGKTLLKVGRAERLNYRNHEFEIVIDKAEEKKVFGRLLIPQGYPGLYDGLATPLPGTAEALHQAAEVRDPKTHKDVVNPQLVKQTLPRYTRQAIRNRVRGTVLMRLVIRKDGTTDAFCILRPLGYGLDDVAVEEVANRWVFNPGTKSGLPVDFPATIEISFSLDSKR